MKRLGALTVLAAAAFAASCTRSGSSPTSKPAEAGHPGEENVWASGKPYVCRRATGPITIDKGDHPTQWAHAMVIKDFFIPISHKRPTSRTVAQMLWDEQYLYVRAVAYDVDLRGTLTGKFARLWTEDAVELFLKPPGPEGYYEFEMSPTNVLLDLEIPIGRHTSYEQRAEWESRAPLAVAVKGTIEKPGDADEYFRLVMAIPWKALNYAGARPPKPGESWKFIFARCDLSKAYGKVSKPRRLRFGASDADSPARQELSTCIRLPKVDFHMYQLYPEMTFSR